jgi:hypothetical protein
MYRVMIVNADTEQDVSELQHGMVIDLSVIGTRMRTVMRERERERASEYEGRKQDGW